MKLEPAMTKLLSLVFFSLVAGLHASAQMCTSPHGKRRALILGIDGATGNQLHYRALIQNKMPSIRRLMMEGEYTPCIDERHPSYGGHKDFRCARAQSGFKTGPDYRWLTGPGWLSVITGVDNDRHGVKDNDPRSLEVYSQRRDKWPTFFMRARRNGLHTAAGGVANFLTSVGDKSKPGIVDYECGTGADHWPVFPSKSLSSCNLNRRLAGDNQSPLRDLRLASFLQKQIQDPQMDIIMGVFDGVDAAGHRHGFSSNDGYLSAMSVVDSQIKPLRTEVRKRAQLQNEQWLVLLTADHGGHNILLWGLHDTREGEDDAVPFVLATYGNCTKLQPLKYPVRHMDVHPTVMAWFDEESPGIDGKVQGL